MAASALSRDARARAIDDRRDVTRIPAASTSRALGRAPGAAVAARVGTPCRRDPERAGRAHRRGASVHLARGAQCSAQWHLPCSPIIASAPSTLRREHPSQLESIPDMDHPRDYPMGEVGRWASAADPYRELGVGAAGDQGRYGQAVANGSGGRQGQGGGQGGMGQGVGPERWRAGLGRGRARRPRRRVERSKKRRESSCVSS